MKENYQTPSIEMIDIEIEDAILQDSVNENCIEDLTQSIIIGDF